MFAAVTLAIGGLAGCGSGTGGTLQPSDKNVPATTPAVVVADTMNNRVLLYAAPISTGQNASIILGQADANGNAVAGMASGLNNPVSAIMDAQGNAWVSDWGNNRVLEFKPPFTTGMNASLVLGQADFTANARSEAGNGFSLPRGLAFDKDGNLWVADAYNNRVLKFVPPFSNGMNSSLVLGKTPGFGMGACSSPDRGLCYPTDLTFDASGNLWVVDNGNNRVLLYSSPFTTTSTPVTVLGQADFSSNTAAAGATGLNYPWGVAIDASGNVWVSDALNWRVLKFAAPFSNHETASLVLGFPDFNSSTNSDMQSSVSNPREIAFDSTGKLFVVDGGNSRVMIFAPPFTNGMRASQVLGKPNFTSVGGTAGAAGMSGPVGVAAPN